LVPAVLSALCLGAGSDAGIAAWLAAHASAVAAVSLAALGLAVISRVAVWIRTAMNIFLDRSIPVTGAPRDYEPAEGDLVTFLSRDGHTLTGMFVDGPADGPGRGLVLFCHEFGSDMTSAGRYARALVRAGYTVFAFDFRGHGRSPAPADFEPRHWPSHHEVNDVLAAVAFVRDRLGLGAAGLGVLGISRGASAAIIAAALSPHIRCLALDSAFSTDTSIDHLIVRWARVYTSLKVDKYGRPIWLCRFLRAVMLLYVELKLRCRYPSALRALARLERVPMLFIMGDRDTYSPVREQRILFDAKPGEKEFWVCPNAKHNQAVAADPRTYAEKVVGFFDRHLGGPGAARG
jgi:pimeloyl-ACP methyl ester carboxylesterase